MPNMPTIVVLARYWEIFRGFRESVDKFAADQPRILVRDPGAGDWPDLGRGWRVIMGPEKFSMAANANLGLKRTPAESDILYCGDDVRFLETLTVERLQQIAYQHPDVGILSPRLRGRGSAALRCPLSACDTVLPAEMWFPCVYIKRELIAAIGYWDERFDSFGDDFDFSVRAALAGYRSAVTNVVTVQHDGDAGGGPSTFVKRGGIAGYNKQSAATFEKLMEKYGVTREVLMRYMRTGDLQLLRLAQGGEAPRTAFLVGE